MVHSIALRTSRLNVKSVSWLSPIDEENWSTRPLPTFQPATPAPPAVSESKKTVAPGLASRFDSVPEKLSARALTDWGIWQVTVVPSASGALARLSVTDSLMA